MASAFSSTQIRSTASYEVIRGVTNSKAGHLHQVFFTIGHGIIECPSRCFGCPDSPTGIDITEARIRKSTNPRRKTRGENDDGLLVVPRSHQRSLRQHRGFAPATKGLLTTTTNSMLADAAEDQRFVPATEYLSKQKQRRPESSLSNGTASGLLAKPRFLGTKPAEYLKITRNITKNLAE